MYGAQRNPGINWLAARWSSTLKLVTCMALREAGERHHEGYHPDLSVNAHELALMHEV